MILVTGASGLVGEAIWRRLAKDWEVLGTRMTRPDARFTPVDLTDRVGVAQLLSQKPLTAVVHCAAAIPVRGVPAFDIVEANLRMVLNLLRALKAGTFFVNISATACYNLRGDGVLTEDTPLTPLSLYTLSKKHIEELLTASSDFMVANVRISSPYSIQRESPSVLYSFINAALRHGRIHLWGSGQRRQAFTNVDILADAVSTMIARNITGDYNLVTTPSIAMHDLAALISRCVPGSAIVYNARHDPEENFRTTIDASKMASIVPLPDSLAEDVAAIVRRITA